MIALPWMTGAEEEEDKREAAGEEGALPTSCSSECPETTLPENPDDLLEERWEEDQTQAPNRRRFRNPETGEVIEFDRGQPGRPGWGGRDHYHRPNPGGGRGSEYLDRHGNPVPRGSGPSNIPPEHHWDTEEHLMTYEKSLLQFAKEFDLYDRGIDYIAQDGTELTFYVDMFHCDDPKRNREDKKYSLQITFASENVKILDGELLDPSDDIFGEILQFDSSETDIDLGVEWRRFNTGKTSWSLFRIDGAPIKVEEKISNRT